MFPVLLKLGYKKIMENELMPKSIYYEKKNSLDALIELHQGYLTESGYLETKNRNICYANGRYIPWTSFAFTYFFDRIDLKNKRILEFGSGASTLYFSNRANSVVSVEFDHEWLVAMSNLSLENKNLILIDGSSATWGFESTPGNGDHLRGKNAIIIRAYDHDLQCGLAIKSYSYNMDLLCSNIKVQIMNSDIIFIDGHYRNTVMAIVAAEKYKKIIIVDNSDTKNTQLGIQYLINAGFKELPFHSLGPLNPYGSTTSIFYLESFDLLETN
jgi:hypothetical protein